MAPDKGTNTGTSKRTFLISRRMVIICLDTFLLLLFIFLLSPRMTGLPMHEVLGILLFLPILLHLLLAWSWIKQTTKRLLKNASRRTRFNYFLNTTLFVLVMIELVSGLAISRVALPFIGINTIDDRSWRALHNLTLNWTRLFVGLHIAVNWKWIVTAFTRRAAASNKFDPDRHTFGQQLLSVITQTAIITIAAGVIAFALFGLLGKPSVSRLYKQDEIARFNPTLGHGIGQFAGEAFLIFLVAFIARRWLRVRL
jgi:Domain of unknown function (DUF4405)